MKKTSSLYKRETDILKELYLTINLKRNDIGASNFASALPSHQQIHLATIAAGSMRDFSHEKNRNDAQKSTPEQKGYHIK